MRDAHRDPVTEHRLLERDERRSGQHKPFVLLHKIIWLLDQHVNVLGEDREIVRPSYHLEQPQILTLRRRGADALNPCIGIEHRLSRRTVPGVRRNALELEVHAVTKLAVHGLELSVPRREAQGEVSSPRRVRRQNLIPDPPTAANEQKVRRPRAVHREVIGRPLDPFRKRQAGLAQSHIITLAGDESDEGVAKCILSSIDLF
jgi:hypothetical protein